MSRVRCSWCGWYFDDSDEFDVVLHLHVFFRMFDGLFDSTPHPEPESSRVRGLRSMANQNESPHERDIAIAKLKEMGLWP